MRCRPLILPALLTIGVGCTYVREIDVDIVCLQETQPHCALEV